MGTTSILELNHLVQFWMLMGIHLNSRVLTIHLKKVTSSPQSSLMLMVGGLIPPHFIHGCCVCCLSHYLGQDRCCCIVWAWTASTHSLTGGVVAIQVCVYFLGDICMTSSTRVSARISGRKNKNPQPHVSIHLPREEFFLAPVRLSSALVKSSQEEQHERLHHTTPLHSALWNLGFFLV